MCGNSFRNIQVISLSMPKGNTEYVQYSITKEVTPMFAGCDTAHESDSFGSK